MPPYCSKCRQEGHILAKCPQKDKRASVPQSPAGQPPAPMDPRFSNPNNKCLHCGGYHRSAVCPTRSQHQPQVLQVMYPVQVSHTIICPHNRARRTVSQQHVAQHRPSWSRTLHKLQTTTQVTILHRLPLRLIQMYPNNITSICLTLSHQHKYLTSFHLHLTSQFHFHCLLLHPLMYQQLLQLLHQTFQQ